MIRPADKPTPNEFDLYKKICVGLELRRNVLRKLLGTVEGFLKLLTRAGVDVGDGFTLIKEGLQKIDLAMPAYKCEYCDARRKLTPTCPCRGRGWFARNQVNEYWAARHRATLVEAGDHRTLAKVVGDLAKEAGRLGDA